MLLKFELINLPLTSRSLSWLITLHHRIPPDAALDELTPGWETCWKQVSVKSVNLTNLPLQDFLLNKKLCVEENLETEE